ncbi:hypothetical protein COY27_02190 [Candidatus Woesearchaeota archaeon CG_4_10_14_0_2_um_filter_33_13]|nr:MAG: hypothetical protein COY27_02190 [Candidatus Woesearchaeota archaeon CG_4_10_14_0_2_um_filter_33_13]
MIKKGWLLLVLLLFLASLVSAAKVDQEILNAFDNNEEVSVIVVLKDLPVSNKAMSMGVASVSDNLEQRREAVVKSQDQVLSKLRFKENQFGNSATNKDNVKLRVADVTVAQDSSDDFDLELGHRYSIINGFSGKVTREGLQKLINDGMVENIYPVKPIVPLLDVSVPLVRADDVWSYSINGVLVNGTGQTVCVIDTGVDYTHSTLGGCTNETFLNGTCSKVIGGYDYAGIDGSSPDSDPQDGHSHGTHVAGIVASEDSTYQGVAPGAKIVAMKVFNDAASVGNTDWAIAAIDWCVNNASVFNISVITMSIGVTNATGFEIPYTSYCDNEDSSGFAAAASVAASQGIFVVASAGNYLAASGITSPSCGANVTSVGSTTDADAVSGYNSAPILSVLAPGSGIISTVLASGFGTKSGTSMAAPHVAGAGVLIIQYWEETYGVTPTFEQIRTKLRNTGVWINDTRNGILFPRINILAAIQPYINYTLPTPANNSEQSNNYVIVNITSDVNLSVAFLEWTNGTAFNYTMNQSDATNFYYNISGLTAGNYTYRVFGNDTGGTFGVSQTRLITIDTTQPNITIITPTNQSFHNSELSLNVSIANLMLSASTYNITNSSGSLIQNNSNLTINQANFTWTDVVNISNSTFVDDNYTIMVWANDSLGNEANNLAEFIVDKTAPGINSVNVTPETVYNNDTVVFTINVTDLYLNTSAIYLESNFSTSWVNYSMETVDNQTFNFSVSGTTNLTNQKNISYRFYAYDYVGNVNSSATYNVAVQNRNISFVNITNPANGTIIEVGVLTQFNGTATDPDNDTLTYAWNHNGNVTMGQSPLLQFNDTGESAVLFVASDSYGSTELDTIIVIVNDTTAPTISSSYDTNVHYESEGGVASLNFLFFDYSGIKNINASFDNTLSLPNTASYCTNLDTMRRNCTWNVTFDASDDGSYTIYINVTDNSTYDNLKSQTYSITFSSCSDSTENGDETDTDCGGSCTACPTTPTSSSSGGGGGGGGATTTVAATTTSTESATETESATPASSLGITSTGGDTAPILEEANMFFGNLSLIKDKSTAFKINKPEIPVSGMVIDSDETKEIYVEVIAFKEKPVEVIELQNVYRYLKMDNGLDNISINLAIIDFEVPISWLQENNYSKKEVVLQHLANNKWEKLKTKLISENNVTIAYQAKTKSFSYFAITSAPEKESFFSRLFSKEYGQKQYVLFGLGALILVLIIIYFIVRDREEY